MIVFFYPFFFSVLPNESIYHKSCFSYTPWVLVYSYFILFLNLNFSSILESFICHLFKLCFSLYSLCSLLLELSHSILHVSSAFFFFLLPIFVIFLLHSYSSSLKLILMSFVVSADSWSWVYACVGTFFNFGL